MFTGWSPSPMYVTRDLDCYAQFEEENIPATDSEIQDSWEEIGQSGGANIPDGAYKILHFAEFDWDGQHYDAGSIVMVKVKCSPKAADAGARSTWVSAAPLGAYPGRQNPYLFKFISSDSYNDNYIKGWIESDIRKMLRDTFINAITRADDPMYSGSNKIARYIKDTGVTKYTNSTGPDGTLADNFPTHDETIWVPSGREIYQGSGAYSTITETLGNRYTWKNDTVLPTGYTHDWSSMHTRSSSGSRYIWQTHTEYSDFVLLMEKVIIAEDLMHRYIIGLILLFWKSTRHIMAKVRIQRLANMKIQTFSSDSISKEVIQNGK